jgi:hypothetical protein
VGSHTIQVIAVDSNGSADPAPAKSSFTVKRPRKSVLHKKRIFALLLGYRYQDSNPGFRN